MFETLQDLCPAGWEISKHCGYDAFVRGGWIIYREPKRGKGWILILLLKGESVPTSHRWYRTPKQAAAYADR